MPFSVILSVILPSSAGSVEPYKARIDELNDEIGRLQGEIFEVKRLSQDESEKMAILENTVHELESEKAFLETSIDESTSLISRLQEENKKRLEGACEDNAEALAWKQKYESLITNGKKQMEDSRAEWLKTNTALAEQATLANNALRDALAEKAQFDLEKKKIEEEAMIIAKKATNETGQFMFLAAVCFLSAIVVISYFVFIPAVKLLIGG